MLLLAVACRPAAALDPLSTVHTVAYGVRRWIPRCGVHRGLPHGHQPTVARLCRRHATEAVGR